MKYFLLVTQDDIVTQEVLKSYSDDIQLVLSFLPEAQGRVRQKALR